MIAVPVNTVRVRGERRNAGGPAELDIFDVQGRLVRRFASRDWPAGPASVDWNGADDQGRPVPSGVYFVRVATADRRATTRIVVSR